MNIGSVVGRLSKHSLLVGTISLLVLLPLAGLSCSPNGTTTETPSGLAAFPVSSPTPIQPPTNAASTASTSTPASPVTTSAASTTTPAGYYITVVYNNNPTQYLTVADLARLPQVQQNVEGTTEQGPTLLAALVSIGIPNISSVTIDGYTKGRLATAELTLTRDQITSNVILALVARGTAKLTGTDIGAAKAIIDVSQITVN